MNLQVILDYQTSYVVHNTWYNSINCLWLEHHSTKIFTHIAKLLTAAVRTAQY